MNLHSFSESNNWELGLYSILIIGIVFLIAFTNEAEKDDGEPDVELSTKVKRYAVIAISVFLTYRVFLILLEFYFLPMFYKYWTKDYSNIFIITHILIGTSVILGIALKKYASSTKASTWVPATLNTFAFLLTLKVISLFGYKNLSNDLIHIVLQTSKDNVYSWDMSAGEVRSLNIEEVNRLKISKQEYPVYIITTNGDTVIKEPRKNERFIYQSTATTDINNCGSGTWNILSKEDQHIEIKIF